MNVGSHTYIQTNDTRPKTLHCATDMFTGEIREQYAEVWGLSPIIRVDFLCYQIQFSGYFLDQARSFRSIREIPLCNIESGFSETTNRKLNQGITYSCNAYSQTAHMDEETTEKIIYDLVRYCTLVDSSALKVYRKLIVNKVPKTVYVTLFQALRYLNYYIGIL